MMQNLIVSAFETVTTVEQGVEVLDIFMHLSSREVNFFDLIFLRLISMTSSDEKMTTASSVCSKLKCMDVGIREGRGRDG